MADAERDQGIVDRLSRQGEEAIGKIAEELIGNSVVNGAMARAFEAREKAVQAQEAAMGALGIPSAADVERVTRRLRSVSQRLEGIEDALDRLEQRGDSPLDEPASERLAAVEDAVGRLDGSDAATGRLEGIESVLDRVEQRVGETATAARLAAIEQRLDEIARDVAGLRKVVAPGDEPMPRSQERLTVTKP